MNYKEWDSIPNTMELYDFYQKIFLNLNNKFTNKLRSKRKFTTLQRYDRLAKKIGLDISNLKDFAFDKEIKPLNSEFLFLLERLHDRIALQLCCCFDKYEPYISKHENIFIYLFGQICFAFDYIEQKLVILRNLYIFQPEQTNNIIYETIEKIFVPQISIILNRILNEFIPADIQFKSETDYIVIKHLDEVLSLIIQSSFDLTKAYKSNIKKFVQNDLKITLEECSFYKTFGNNEDKYFPSIDLLNQWIANSLINECNIEDNNIIFSKIRSKHILLSIFRKIKQQMLNKPSYYSFEYLISDLFFYLNELQHPVLSTKNKHVDVDNILSNCVFNNHIKNEKDNYYQIRRNLLKDNKKYLNVYYNDEFVLENFPNYFPREKIFRNLTFTNNKDLPTDLLEYLYYGIPSLKNYSEIEKILNLLKQYNSSKGINIIYLFTEAIIDLINNNLKSARTKITKAYKNIDNYPIGLHFYAYIFSFYIGICQINKKTPYQFMKQINLIANYTRRSFVSKSMHFDLNLYTKTQQQSSLHVENSILIREMCRYNQFCEKFKLSSKLLFNPFSEIEEFHQIIFYIKDTNTLPTKVNINSISDILEYIESDEESNFFRKYKWANKNPKVNFTHDNIYDFYESREFYHFIISELKLTEILRNTVEILRLY